MPNKTHLSIPKSKTVCGYEIRKMPIGRYLEAIDEVSAFPAELLGACFPDMEFSEIVERLARFDEKLLQACIFNLFTTAPRHTVNFVAKLTDIPSQTLMDDPNIGLDGLSAIILAFIEVNSLGKSWGTITKIREKLGVRSVRLTPTTPGSSASSPPPSPSA